MCTVIGCDHGHGTSSVGVSAEGVLAVLGVLGAATAVGAVFRVALVPIGVALALSWLLYWRPTRSGTLTVCSVLTAGGLWLARFAWRRLRKPSRAVALPREFTATVYVTGPNGQRRVLGTAPVPGTWTSQADVEAEVVARWIAKHGRHPAGEIGCHAQPTP